MLYGVLRGAGGGEARAWAEAEPSPPLRALERSWLSAAVTGAYLEAYDVCRSETCEGRCPDVGGVPLSVRPTLHGARLQRRLRDGACN